MPLANRRSFYLFAALGLGIAARSAESKKEAEFFGLSNVHKVEISLPATEWSVLQTSGGARNAFGGAGTDFKMADGRPVHIGSGFGYTFPWAHADVVLDGEKFKDVGLRYRGNGSFSRSSGTAPFRANWKIKLDLFGTDGTWNGQKTVNFNAGVVDTTLSAEALAFTLFRAAGVPAPRVAYANFTFDVPGYYKQTDGGGPYVVIEDVNGRFLKNTLPPGTGLLMKPEGTRGGIQAQGFSWAAYLPTFRPDREATVHEQQRVMEFCNLISQTNVELFRTRIGSYLDVDEFLRFIAVNAFIGSTDSYLGGGHNYYVYLDPKDDKIRFIPWDEDSAMRGSLDFFNPQRNDNPLIYWILDDPKYQAQYRAILRELATKTFTDEKIAGWTAAVEKVVGARANSARAFLESRARTLRSLVAGWEAESGKR